MGNHDEALKAFDRALEISPDYSLALEWKGDALMDQGKYEDALIAYEKAIGTDTIFPKLWYKKGTALKAWVATLKLMRPSLRLKSGGIRLQSM